MEQRTDRPGEIHVIAPNFKRRYSGVTSTILALVPVQRRFTRIVAVGPGLPADLPTISMGTLLRELWHPPADVPFRIWHARRNVEMVAGLLAKWVLRSPLRIVFTSAAQRRHQPFTRWLLRRMDAVIATSAKAKSYLEVEATVIPHGIDTRIYRPASDAREGARECWIGCFGRIRPNKGTDLFVDALLEILPDFPHARAVMLGGATKGHAGFAGSLRDRMAAAGMTDRCHMPGEVAREEVIAWYRRLSLFVAPQRWEGFGLTVPEAMASGVPVVATDVGAFSEFITSDEVGRLVPPDDGAALERAIRDLLADPARLEAMGRTARTTAERNFDIETEARAIQAVYDRLWSSARSDG